jgi:hypothetical protein
MELYYDRPAVQVSYNADDNYIHTYWKGFCPSAIFRESFEVALNIMKEKKTTKVFFDGGNAKLSSPEDQSWLINDWTPRAVVEGYKYYAVVLPKDVFGQFSSKMVIQQTNHNNPISSVTTDNTEEALAWLLAQ